MRKEYLAECPPILKEYLGYMQVIRGRSENTVNEYFIDIRLFLRYMKQLRGLVPPTLPENEIDIRDVDATFLSTVTLTDVYEFMNYLRGERSNSNKTRARKTSSLRMFFKYLTDYTHALETNPIRNLDTPKQKKSLPRYLTLEQAMELLRSVSGEYAERDYCMLVLFLNCGAQNLLVSIWRTFPIVITRFVCAAKEIRNVCCTLTKRAKQPLSSI